MIPGWHRYSSFSHEGLSLTVLATTSTRLNNDQGAQAGCGLSSPQETPAACLAFSGALCGKPHGGLQAFPHGDRCGRANGPLGD